MDVNAQYHDFCVSQTTRVQIGTLNRWSRCATKPVLGLTNTQGDPKFGQLRSISGGLHKVCFFSSFWIGFHCVEMLNCFYFFRSISIHQ